MTLIGKVQENGLPDAGISEQDIASTFCNFSVDKTTNIRYRLKITADLFRKGKGTQSARIQSTLESYVQKIKGKKQGHRL